MSGTVHDITVGSHQDDKSYTFERVTISAAQNVSSQSPRRADQHMRSLSQRKSLRSHVYPCVPKLFALC